MSGFGSEWLAQLVEALPVGVFILDADGVAVYSNATAHALLGRPIREGDHADNLRDRYAAFIAGTDEPYPTKRMPIVRALAGERVHVDDMEIERDGRRIALDVTATPILDDQHRVAFAVAVFQDITVKKKLARSAFLSNVTHELRTPLSHIIGFTELLAEEAESERMRNFAMNALTGAMQLLEKIDELIELARHARESDLLIPRLEKMRDVRDA